MSASSKSRGTARGTNTFDMVAYTGDAAGSSPGNSTSGLLPARIETQYIVTNVAQNQAKNHGY